MSNTRWLFHLRSLPPAALALAAYASGNVALAQTGDPAAGGVLYNQRITFPVSGLLNCADCHGENSQFRLFFLSRNLTESDVLTRLNGAIASDRGGGSLTVVDGMGLYASVTQQGRADIAAYIMRGAAPPPPPTPPPPSPTPAPPTPTASPSDVSFGSTQVGASSAPLNVLFTNSAAVNVTFANPAIVPGGTNAGDFLVTTPPSGTTQCIAGRVMAPGTSCSFGAQFAPSAAGTRTATWAVNFTGSVAPSTLMLRGTASITSAPAPGPVPSPAPAPAPPSSANAPTSGGGGALGWANVLGLAALSGLAAVRRRRRD